MKIKLTICLLAFLNFYEAQENISYQKPSAEILKLADYERPPSVITNSKKDWIVFTYRATYKTLDDLNQQEMKLGGLRINPVTNISSSTSYAYNLKVRKMNDKNEVQVNGLPANPKITNTSFSPDEKKLAFTNTTERGVELWVIDLETATAKKITKDNLNANLGNPYIWMKDSQSFLIKVLPENRAKLSDSSKDLPTVQDLLFLLQTEKYLKTERIRICLKIRRMRRILKFLQLQNYITQI